MKTKQSLRKVSSWLAVAAFSAGLLTAGSVAAAPLTAEKYVAICPMAGGQMMNQPGLVLFATQQYANWQWHYERYPDNMSFAVLTAAADAAAPDSLALRMLQENLQPEVYRQKIAIVAALGAAAPQTDIGIEEVRLYGKELTVRVHTKSARLNQPLTRNLTYPYDYVLLDRQGLDLRSGLNVTFIDQQGAVLSRVKLTDSQAQRAE